MTLEGLRALLKEAQEKRARLVAELEGIVNAAEARETRDFTPDENVSRGRLAAHIDQAESEITTREDAIREYEARAVQERQDEQVRQMRRELGLPEVSGMSGVTDINEFKVYERNNGISYLKDVCFAGLGAGAVGNEYFRALDRLQTHGRQMHVEALELDGKQQSSRSVEEDYFLRQMVEAKCDRRQFRGSTSDLGQRLSYRALSTASTAGGEFVPPMYLTQQFIEFMRAGRVIADCQHHEDLPDGTMSLNIPKVISGTSVDTQASQNTDVSDVDLQTAFVTFPVVTKAGMQIVSLQLLERSPIAFDQAVLRDLAKDLGKKIDAAVVNGQGGGTDFVGILATGSIGTVTWTQGTPTVKGLYGQIGLAKVDIETSLYLPPTHAFLTPNCWEWISQSFDTAGRPLVVPSYNGPFNAISLGDNAAEAEGRVGRVLNGLATFSDNNIPQNLGSGVNQDVAIISRPDENWLLEGPVTTRAYPQTLGQQLSIMLQLYEYAAFTAARYPNANAVVTGTGMASANRTFNS